MHELKMDAWTKEGCLNLRMIRELKMDAWTKNGCSYKPLIKIAVLSTMLALWKMAAVYEIWHFCERLWLCGQMCFLIYGIEPNDDSSTIPLPSLGTQTFHTSLYSSNLLISSAYLSFFKIYLGKRDCRCNFK